MIYRLSAYRCVSQDPASAVVEGEQFSSLSSALKWVANNAFTARSEAVLPRFSAEVDEQGIARMKALYEGPWWEEHIKCFNAVRTVIIERAEA